MDRLTQKQENYVLGLYQGLSQRQAYIKAGYSLHSAPGTMDIEASRMAALPKISLRLDEMRALSEAETHQKVGKVRQFLNDIIDTTPADVLQLSEDGRDLRIKPEAMHSKVTGSIRTSQVMIGGLPVRVTSLGMLDKLKAVDILNKMDRVYSDSVPASNQTINILVMNEEAKRLTESILSGKRTEE